MAASSLSTGDDVGDIGTVMGQSGPSPHALGLGFNIYIYIYGQLIFDEGFAPRERETLLLVGCLADLFFARNLSS